VLADIFRLTEASPLLLKFYRRDFAEELCADARKGAVELPAREPAGPPQGEALECAARRVLDQRALTPLRELLSLRVLVNAEVRITEEDATAKATMSEIRRARNADVTLGQVIHGLLWELSFHGGPQEQLEVSEDFRRPVFQDSRHVFVTAVGEARRQSFAATTTCR
jgi:hypothetical protein